MEPLGYIRDLLCLIPSWPVRNVLELAPANWSKAVAKTEVATKLEANVFRRASTGLLKPVLKQ